MSDLDSKEKVGGGAAHAQTKTRVHRLKIMKGFN